MQSSSKALSTLVADRVLKKCKQRLLLLLFLKIKIPYNSHSQRGLLGGRVV